MSLDERAVKLAPECLAHLAPEFDAPYMQVLRQFLLKEKQAGKIIFPKGDEYFNALNTTPLDRVKVVILGQDPYHGPGQAHGLCFSVRENVEIPPSLKNIYKEIQSDLGDDRPFSHGNLQGWAEQGVLLLNSVLTVQKNNANSHQGKGWEQFTDQVIKVVAEEKEHCVFLLWGAYAQKKGQVINPKKHLVLKAPHPSPLAAHRGFFGCKHFSKCNDYLVRTGQTPIDWFAH